MADALYFAPLRVPIVDPRTGLMSREWYLFFQGLWMRSGGTDGPNIDDLLQNSAEGVSTADVLAILQTAYDALAQQPVVVAELRERIAVLEQEVQALKQGPII